MSELNYQQKKQEQKKYYNETAEKYDSWHVEVASAKVVDEWNFENLKAILINKQVEKCLDLGCGTGRLSNSLLQIVEKVYGVDQSKEVLKIAKNKFPKLELTCAESVDLPFKNNFFDLVVINGSLHHFFAKEKTLAEAFRVLKPNGIFAVLGEPNKNFSSKLNPFFYLWILTRLVLKVIDLVKGNKNKQFEIIEPEAELFKPKELKQILQQTGFQIIDFYTYDYLSRFENKRWLKNYKKYLNFERKFTSRIMPSLGSAIQFFCRKD